MKAENFSCEQKLHDSPTIVSGMASLGVPLLLHQLPVRRLAATYSSSKVMKGLLVRGHFGGLSSAEIFVALPMMDILGVLCKKFGETKNGSGVPWPWRKAT